jgi:hypothetical protein
MGSECRRPQRPASSTLLSSQTSFLAGPGQLPFIDRGQTAPRQATRQQTRPDRRYHVPADSARIIAALLALRDHVIAPILAGCATSMGRKPKAWTVADRDHENLRAGMQTLFVHVGIDTFTTPA